MQTSSRKASVVLIGLLVLGFVVYRSSGMLHLGDFSGTKLLHAVRNANPFLLILYRFLPFSGVTRFVRCGGRFFSKIWAVAFPKRFIGLTLAGFSAIFSAGARRRAVRPFLLRGGEVACFRDVGDLRPGAPIRFGQARL